MSDAFVGLLLIKMAVDFSRLLAYLSHIKQYNQHSASVVNYYITNRSIYGNT
jgi:hypothetical protein